MSDMTGLVLIASMAVSISVIALVAVVDLRRTAVRLHPPQAAPLASPLDAPVTIPAGHPERFPELDELDARLAEWHDVLWPQEEWRIAEACRFPGLDPYETGAAAREVVLAARAAGADVRGQRVRRCACGLFHIHHGARRTSR